MMTILHICMLSLPLPVLGGGFFISLLLHLKEFDFTLQLKAWLRSDKPR